MQSNNVIRHASGSTAAAAETPSTATDGFAITRGGQLGYTADTAAVLRAAGGQDGVVRVLTAFYSKFHEDRHLKQFLGGLQQPLEVHARRLGLYITEQMGKPDAPWSKDLEERERKVIRLAGGRSAVVTDRFSAHHCAWHSVDRAPERVGRRFKLDDCRVWMRLMFWALRDCGHGEDSPFFRYMLKFVAHFIAIYEQTARQFTLLEARWSHDPRNLEIYERNGRFMGDVVDVPLSVAIAAIPAQERRTIDDWLYDNAKIVDGM
jgi:hypothetical protein